MNKKTLKVYLSEKDKKTILQNKNICTESHGKGCNDLLNVSLNSNRKLN